MLSEEMCSFQFWDFYYNLGHKRKSPASAFSEFHSILVKVSLSFLGERKPKEEEDAWKDIFSVSYFQVVSWGIISLL